MKLLNIVLVFCAVILFADFGIANDKVLEMSTTTSTQASGLLDVLLPAFTKDTGIEVKVIAKGTGAAIRDGKDGNVDVIFVHAKNREDEFVEEGYGTKRYAVMHNDFVIIGPSSDPAGVKKAKNAKEALEKIAKAKASFISRGDDSGTHTKEQILWKASDVGMKTRSYKIMKKGKQREVSYFHPEGLGEWYYSIGQGMGKTLTFAEEKQAYTLTDRGTYLKYKLGRDKSLDLEILFEGDEALYNPYGVIPINPEKYPHVDHAYAKQFAKWLISEKGQKLIADYTLMGNQLFYPDAMPDVK